MKRLKLTSKILLMIGIPVLAVYFTANIYTAKAVRQSVTDLTTDGLTAKSQAASNEIGACFSTYETIVEQMTANDLIRQYFAKPYEEKSSYGQNGYGGVKNTLENICQTDPDNLSSVWYGDCATGLMIAKNRDKPYKKVLSEYPWYQPAVDKKGVVLVEPYDDITTGKKIMSIVSPIYQTGTEKPIGFAGIDITLDRLYETMKSYKLGTDGFYMLATVGGQLIYHPDEALKNKNVKDAGMSDNITKAIQAHKSGFFTYTALGRENFGYVAPVGNTGWTVTTGLPENEFFASYHSVLHSSILIFLAAIIILFVLILLVSKSIVHPLAKLRDTAGKIADGKLNVTVETAASDEVGQVSRAIARTVERLKQYIAYIDEISEVLNQIAAGDLTFELHCDYSGEFAKIKDSLENIKSNLAHTFSEINEAANQVASGSGQIADASQTLAQGSTEQASSIEELSASITEISRKVSDNADHAEETRKLFEDVGKELNHSNEQMRQLTAAMSDISTSSSEIGKIIKAIEDIAFQTNILALNAAVEAARAGEAGKGFSVVADEVRQLASKSSEAAKSTTALVQSEIQSVRNGSEIADHTAKAMESVVASSGKCTDLVRKIADASGRQADSIRQVTQGLDQISNVVQTNSATAEESAASSEELNEQAQALKELIGRFRLR